MMNFCLEPEQFADFCKKHPNVLILDASQHTYSQAHLPGARWVKPQRMMRQVDMAMGYPPTQEELIALWTEVGLHAEQPVVVYDDEGGGWAGRLMWLLHLSGHQQVYYLNGGIHAWTKLGYETTQQVPATVAAKTPYPLNWQDKLITDYETVLANLSNVDWVLWDTRPAAMYEGRQQSAALIGHIPGAVNLPWTFGIDRNRGLRLKPLEEINTQLEECGITPDKHIVCYCHTFHSAAFVYMLLFLLEYPSISAYAGSWSEWGNRYNSPVEIGDVA